MKEAENQRAAETGRPADPPVRSPRSMAVRVNSRTSGNRVGWYMLKVRTTGYLIRCTRVLPFLQLVYLSLAVRRSSVVSAG
ncbi:hypothetical protein KCP78_21025 [Salmonella enterica subsp. enterica]|nr:hypothetical protein KCP78_21025 [Salmonella enterica subsp. enterica]